MSPAPQELSMPVTAKLSRAFYEKLGDDATNELVTWFNDVDATYRSDLRELNETNFARFDAKLEQRISELRMEFAQFRGDMQVALARLEGGLIARIGLAEGRLARLTTALWISTLAAIVALRTL